MVNMEKKNQFIQALLKSIKNVTCHMSLQTRGKWEKRSLKVQEYLKKPQTNKNATKPIPN